MIVHVGSIEYYVINDYEGMFLKNNECERRTVALHFVSFRRMNVKCRWVCVSEKGLHQFVKLFFGLN